MKQQQGAVNAIILNKNNEFLLVERSLSDDYMAGYWELPGGGVDYGETPQESLRREIKEECGIGIKIIKPVAANTYFINDLQRIEITFLCDAIDENVELSSEHSNFGWFKKDKINDVKVSDYVSKIIKSSPI